MKFLIVSIFTLTTILTFKSMAQQKDQQPPAVLNHIAVYVSDLKVSTDFYLETFNLKQIPEPFHDQRHTWFSLGASGALHLIQGERKTLEYDKNEHLCFSVADVTAFIVKLKKKKIEFSNWAGAPGEVTLRVDGVKQIYFKDPDGHWLEVNDAK